MPLIISIMIIVVGIGLLLTALGVGPGINWLWTLGLGVIGILVFVVSKGIDKISVVLGPFFLFASLLSMLRQTGWLSVDIEVPVLVITIGILLLVAQLPAIPKPRWYEEPRPLVQEPSAPKKLRLENAPGTPIYSPTEGGKPAGGR